MTASLTSWLDSLSALQLAVVCCAFFVAITLLGIVLIHPLMRRWIHGERQANDVVIFVAANYGLIYAVLLGLLTVATFDTTKDLQDHIADEASSLSTLYHSADGYPEPLRSRLKAELRDYTHYVIEKDWPAHRKTRIPQGGEHRLQAIREALFSFEPASKTQEVLHSEIIREFNAMNVSREQRLSAVTSAMPVVLWCVVIFGGVLTLVFLWMIHMDFIPQIFLGVMTALFLGVMTFLIFAMDHPFQGAISVGPDAFQSVYDLAMKWDEPSQAAGAEERRFHSFASLGTGPTDGVYYPVGAAICAIVNEDILSSGLRCSSETTPGSVYNIDALRSGELEFGLVQSDVAFNAYRGEGAFLHAPFRDLRSVLALYTEFVTIVARPDIHQLADLRGKRINVGPEGSGSRATWEGIQGALGWSQDQAPRIVDMANDAIGRALCSGSIDAALLVLGHPSARILDILDGCTLNLVPVEGPAIDAFVAARPYFTKERISGSFYRLAADVPSFGVTAILMTTANMDSRVVAEFAKSLTARIDELKAKHPVLENLTAQSMAPERLPAPLHPAAAQAYAELGLRK